MTVTSENSLASFFLDPLERQQETADFLYFIEKADAPSPSLHANIYFSPLRTVFLSQHQNPLAVATLYSPLVCRDGLLELCHLFYSHPEPTSKNIQLLIRHEFANFVPEKWRPHVGFYQYQTTKNDLSKVKDIYVLLTFAEKNHCSLVFLKQQLEAIKTRLGTRWTDVQMHVVPVSPRTPQEKPELSGEMMAHYSQSLHEISQFFGPQLKFASWTEVTKSALNQALVIDINEHFLHYGDSYLVQYFLKDGGQVLANKNSQLETDISLKMSFHHQICMSKDSPHFNQKIAKQIEDKMTLVLQSRTYRGEAAAFEQQRAERNELLKDYCASFKSLVHHLAAEYL